MLCDSTALHSVLATSLVIVGLSGTRLPAEVCEVTQLQKVYAVDGESDDRFGAQMSVALDGNTLVVGAEAMGARLRRGEIQGSTQSVADLDRLGARRVEQDRLGRRTARDSDRPYRPSSTR